MAVSDSHTEASRYADPRRVADLTLAAAVRAHAEAVHRFYGDKPTALAIYRKYDPAASEAEIGRMYESIRSKLILDRIPAVQRAAAASTAERVGGEVPAAKSLDFQHSIDMRIVRRLADLGY